MVTKKRCVAMLLAGGQGSRLSVLTKYRAKPAVSYGGKYKIIDFPLSNCAQSGIDTVGVLTQYEPLELNGYIGTGAPWDLDSMSGGAYVLPPYQSGEHGEWYSGTANAIFQNIYFIDRYNPDYILVLSGDHIYKMDYSKMINAHREKGADATIAVIRVPMEEASRFGIMNADANFKIIDFEEKPREPKSDMASMGVYVFSWKELKQYLVADSSSASSHNDFGKDIIPAMLNAGENLYAYPFEGYWKDVGTLQSLWEANMELLGEKPALDLYDDSWKILSRNANKPPHFVDMDATVENSIVAEGCYIYGQVKNSVLFPGVVVEKGAIIEDSIVMQETSVGKGSIIKKAIIDEEVTVGEKVRIGGDDALAVIGFGCIIEDGAAVNAGQQIFPRKTVEAEKGGADK